jgi:ribonuclease-3 family protein
MKDYLNFTLPPSEIQAMSSLALAHVGDCVHELLVLSWLCQQGRTTSRGLHREAVAYVQAPAQAEAVKRIMDILTPEEEAVYRRGRNTKVNSIPQHAEISQYHAATGLEALFGWLYLLGRRERLNTLFERMMEGEDAT